MVMSLKFLDPEALNILFLMNGRFNSSERIYLPKNRLFVFVFMLETLSYTAFRNCSDTFVCPKFRVGSHVVTPGDRVRKRSIIKISSCLSIKQFNCVKQMHGYRLHTSAATN